MATVAAVRHRMPKWIIMTSCFACRTLASTGAKAHTAQAAPSSPELKSS